RPSYRASLYESNSRARPVRTVQFLNTTALVHSSILTRQYPQMSKSLQRVSGLLSESAPMLAPLLGYFFCMITMLTAVTVLLTSFSGISTRLKQGRHHPRPPVIGRTVTAEETAQWHSPVAKEASPAKDVSP